MPNPPTTSQPTLSTYASIDTIYSSCHNIIKLSITADLKYLSLKIYMYYLINTECYYICISIKPCAHPARNTSTNENIDTISDFCHKTLKLAIITTLKRYTWKT